MLDRVYRKFILWLSFDGIDRMTHVPRTPRVGLRKQSTPELQLTFQPMWLACLIHKGLTFHFCLNILNTCSMNFLLEIKNLKVMREIRRNWLRYSSIFYLFILRIPSNLILFPICIFSEASVFRYYKITILLFSDSHQTRFCFTELG